MVINWDGTNCGKLVSIDKKKKKKSEGGERNGYKKGDSRQREK